MSYEDLCKRVEKIDPKAAEYMRGEAKKKPFSPQEDLSMCFYWDSTPQGYDYWLDIHNKLGIEQEMDILKAKIEYAMKVLKLSQRKLSAKLGKSENYLANINRENLSDKRKEEIIREIDCLLNGGQVKSDTKIIAELTQQVAELQDTNHELRTLYQKERQKLSESQEINYEIIEKLDKCRDENNDLRNKNSKNLREIANLTKENDELQNKERGSKIVSYPNLELRNLKREYEDKLYSIEKAHCKFKRATWTLIVAVLFLLCVLGLWAVL